MALITFEGNNTKIPPFPCRSCKQKINSLDPFYYCSLCNFFVCKNCFNIKNMQTFLDPTDINPQFKEENSPSGYLSNNPMDEKNNEGNHSQYLCGDQMQFK